MFKLLRKSRQIKDSILASIGPKQDPTQLIAEIHESFDSATDKLLAEARRILSSNENLEKGRRLNDLGFTSTYASVNARQHINNLTSNKRLAELIGYFKLHYPNNKFITDSVVKELCKKYGLVFGDCRFYKGVVPEKNINDMEAFNLMTEDMNKYPCGWHARGDNKFYGYYKPIVGEWGRFSSFIEVTNHSQEFGYEKDNFMVCASVTDFDTKNMSIEDGYKLNLNIPDPVVLQPVKGGYLIVTKWGLEANDPELTNELHN